MKITEYCDVLSLEISITYYPNQSNRWSAQFEDAEVKDNSILVSEYGNGNTPEMAIADYVSKVKGKTIVIGSHTSRRREFVVPKTLEPI